MPEEMLTSKTTNSPDTSLLFER